MAVGLLRRSAVLAASCAASALLAAQGAQAQTADAHPVNKTATSDSLPEVVVTAQKRVENIQNVPEQVTVLSNQFINQIHATDLEDVAGYVPGLEVLNGGTPGQTVLSIRGIFPLANTTVATYVDDTPIGGTSLYSNAEGFSLDLLPYDVANLQVLSGPQGTLYGASSLGGLLKYELIQPNLNTFQGEIGGDLQGVENGSGPGGGARASLNGPIVQDKLGLVASYSYENTPGYIDDVQTGEKSENGVRQQGARIGLLWTPATRLKIELNVLYQQVDADGLAEVALDPNTLRPLAGELKDNNYTSQPFRKEITSLSDRTTYDFGFADLTSVTSYEYSNVEQRTDVTRDFGVLVSAVGGPTPTITPEDQHLQLRKYTEEVRLASKADKRLEWLIGSFVTYEHSSLYQDVPALNGNGTPITPFTAPALGGISIYNPLALIYLPSIYREYALFGDFTLHVTPRLDLQGGVRYSYNSQNFTQLTTGSVESLAFGAGHSNDNVATFNVSPSYKITRDVNAYVRIASGYQPGGPNIILAGVPPKVNSDTLTQYEAGLKTQFLNRRGTFDIAAFYNKWNDIQLSVLAPPPVNISYIANGGDAKSEGVDATGSFAVLPGLTVGSTFDYTYAAFTQVDSNNGLGAVKGDSLPQVPRFSGSARVNYLHPLINDWSYGVGAALRLESSRLAVTNYTTLIYREPGYGALDLNASLQNNRYTIRLFAKNVTDTRSYNYYGATLSELTGTPPQVSGILIQPRTVGISVDAKF